MNIDNLFRETVKKNASDLHLIVGQPPIIRINGALRPIQGAKTLTPSSIKELVFDIITEKQRENFLKNLDLDVSYEISNLARFRINLYFEKGNIALAARVIPGVIPTMKDLIMPNIVYDLIRRDHGLILVTGPTGCGKSTSLASMIEFINNERSLRIITLEDPIEFVFESKKSLISQRQLHTDMLNFESALTHVLRQDPNIIVVGEMRNLETIASAVTLAETGHLVLATLHTHNAYQTVDRIIDIFPSHQQNQIRLQLSMSLAGIISQKLIKRIKGGRLAVREVLVNIPAVGNMIRENKISQIETVIQTNAEQGMFTMDQNLMELYRTGEISLETTQANILDEGMIDSHKRK
ncbi:MAG: PilT/PilU family type 4a pilus ATPase [Xanthomonadaceae bacterium]|nr:PilT/PilU family type 4a pilus ATPase [Rhodospirillaceae bacterium]NIA17909.1 PilT/PilU family type 4a pilus ATPase [Xanthomonadaceae bacterium]